MLDDPRLPPRFWSKVVPEPMSGCWLWTAAIQCGGYGAFNGGVTHGRRVHVAHRFAYEGLVGAVPEGLELDHLCRVRCCVNPAHLEPVTTAENTRRGVLYENQRRRFASATHCRAGHELSGANLDLRVQVSVKGATYPHRRCVACAKTSRAARYLAERKAA